MALSSFPLKRIILIAGGADKNLNFSNFAKQVKKVKQLILFKGTASSKIKRKLKKQEYKQVNSMKQAVKQAQNKAKKGDIVLLSPGCASFGLFKHEFDRGEQFVKEVKKLL